MGPDEVWAAIHDFPDYAISNYGIVFNTTHNRFLSPTITSYGHRRVALYRDGERYDLYVHRLVAAAFYAGWDSNLHIRHQDNVRSNNDALNLTSSEGEIDGYMFSPEEPIFKRVIINEINLIFNSVSECAEYVGGDAQSILRVIRGQRMSYRGYSYAYV